MNNSFCNVKDYYQLANRRCRLLKVNTLNEFKHFAKTVKSVIQTYRSTKDTVYHNFEAFVPFETNLWMFRQCNTNYLRAMHEKKNVALGWDVRAETAVIPP